MKELEIGKGVALPLNVVTAKAAIMAMTGMGKTYLARVVAEEMLKHGAQIVVGDYTGVWWGLTSSASGKREGFPVVVFGGEHADVPLTEDAGRLIADVVVNERVSAILDVSGFEHDAPKIRFMTEFARRLYHANRRPMHFFLDEADEFVPQNPQRDQIAMLSVIKRIWQRGRVKGIGGTIISQRPAAVHKTLLNQSEMLIALRTVGPQDRRALAAWFESWGTDDQVEEFQRTISNLPDHHAWFWSPKHKLFVQSKARALETFDSGRTPDVESQIVEPERRAKIDVAKLGKEIEKLAAAAVSDDPEVLKRQVQDLAKKFADMKTYADTLEERLKARPEKVKVERPGKPIKIAALGTRTLKEIGKTRKAISGVIAGLNAAAKAAAASVSDVEAVVLRLDRELTRAEGLNASTAIADAGRKLAPDAVPEPRIYREIEVPVDFAGNGSVRGGQRSILAALAQHGECKPSKLRILSGIKSKETMRTYLQKLRQARYVAEGSGGTFSITNTGRHALGAFVKLPEGPALLEHWKRELGAGGMGQIFRVLADRRGFRFSTSALMGEAGIKSPETFRTYMQKLRALELVEEYQGEYLLARDFSS